MTLVPPGRAVVRRLATRVLAALEGSDAPPPAARTLHHLRRPEPSGPASVGARARAAVAPSGGWGVLTTFRCSCRSCCARRAGGVPRTCASPGWLTTDNSLLTTHSRRLTPDGLFPDRSRLTVHFRSAPDIPRDLIRKRSPKHSMAREKCRWGLRWSTSRASAKPPPTAAARKFRQGHPQGAGAHRPGSADALPCASALLARAGQPSSRC